MDDSAATCLLLMVAYLLNFVTANDICQPGWRHYDEKCLFFSINYVDWARAQEICEIYNAALVTVASVDKNSYIWSHINVPSWIGLRDVEQDGTFAWKDGTGITYDNWDTDQPDNAGTEYCGFMDSFMGKWFSETCVLLLNFVCEKTTVGTGEPTPCGSYLVSGMRGVTDDKLTASSTKNPNGPYQARLFTEASSDIVVQEKVGAWSPLNTDTDAYIQVEFSEAMVIMGVVTQGRDINTCCDERVTAYKLLTSMDGVAWHEATNTDGSTMVLPGNEVKGTLKENMLPCPEMGQFVRIKPTAYEGNISLRFDILGCSSMYIDNVECGNSNSACRCDCKLGYASDIWKCMDTDECSSAELNECDTNADCKNTEGSYTCSCRDGYKGDGLTCTDENECLMSAHTCVGESNCINSDGAFTCGCDNCHSLEGFNCSDIDECEDGNYTCHDHAKCKNTIGSYICVCKDGYSGDGKTCVDIDECDGNNVGNGCDTNAKCENAAGSFSCTCQDGYTGNGIHCSEQALTTTQIIGITAGSVVGLIVIIIIIVIVMKVRRCRR